MFTELIWLFFVFYFLLLLLLLLLLLTISIIVIKSQNMIASLYYHIIERQTNYVFPFQSRFDSHCFSDGRLSRWVNSLQCTFSTPCGIFQLVASKMPYILACTQGVYPRFIWVEKSNVDINMYYSMTWMPWRSSNPRSASPVIKPLDYDNSIITYMYNEMLF